MPLGRLPWVGNICLRGESSWEVALLRPHRAVPWKNCLARHTRGVMAADHSSGSNQRSGRGDGKREVLSGGEPRGWSGHLAKDRGREGGRWEAPLP